MTSTPESSDPVTGSFRDPSGRMFGRNGRLLRQINRTYAAQYDHLIESGLYAALVDRRLLIPHTEVSDAGEAPADAYRIVEPERIPFISYPYEWSFSQLKAAGLATLRIQRMAVEHGMVLKDASAYNIQFRGFEPTLIDTLSFERWQEGTPWVAYRQFCQHFAGALALMSRTDIRLGGLSRIFIDGPPLDLISRLLPARSKLSPALLMHLHLHARAQRRHGSRALTERAPTRFSRRSMMGLVEHLQSTIEGLTYDPGEGPWVDYYDRTNYSAEAMAHKQRVVSALVERERPLTVWDLGANTGAFSRLASAHGACTIAFDADAGAVERHYLDCRERREGKVLPLVMDLANPSGRIGWGHAERQSLADRGPADLVLALGLIHHLSLANQVPFEMVAEFLHRVGRALVIEFVPRTDSQVRAMLSRMPRLDESYSLEAFERGFARFFTPVDMTPIADSERRVYCMRARASV